jgi:hypothetical protein
MRSANCAERKAIKRIQQMTRLKFALFGIVFLFALSISSGQNVLQMETRGKIEGMKFYPGDEISIKLIDEKFWRHTYLLDVEFEKEQVEFDFGTAKLDEIVALKTPQQRFRGRSLQKKLLLSSASFILLSPVELIYQDDPNWGIMIGGASLGVIGMIFRPIFDTFSVHRIGKRKRLRMLDLNLPEPVGEM